MKYKLICIDIDGTLLDDDKRLLPQVKESLRKVSAKGAQLLLASGRMPAGVESIEKELGVPCIKVCNAGTYVLMENQCISTEHLSLETMKKIYMELAEKYEVPLWIFRGREWYVTDIDKYVENEIRIIQRNPEIVTIDYLAEKWDSEKTSPNKLLLAADPPKLKEIYLEVKSRKWKDIDMACSAATFIEIFPKGVTKATALLAVCKKLGISMEETIAFGDQELDIPMIEAAGTGVAMGNAIQELKDKADFITKSNNEAGIAYALEHYFVTEGGE